MYKSKMKMGTMENEEDKEEKREVEDKANMREMWKREGRGGGMRGTIRMTQRERTSETRRMRIT